MKTGYDKFFEKAKKNASQGQPVPKRAAPGKFQSSKFPSGESGEALKKIVQQKTQQLARKRRQKLDRQFPTSAAFALMTFLGLGVAGFYQQDQLIGLLESVEIKVFGSASASTAEGKSDHAAEKATSKSKEAAESAEGAAEVGTASASKASPLTEEEINLFKGLQDRSKALDQKEAELKKMEEELQKQRESLEKRLAEIEGVRKNIANQLEEKVKVDKDRVEQLVQFYSTMKPQQAAKIIESLNEDLAIEVLVKMKKKSVAEIMNLINPEKAQRLSERFAGYRVKNRTTASSKEVEP